MKYTVDILIKDKQVKKYIFFWGHTAAKDGSITKSCFSQWWESPFTVDCIQYKTAEHWMMAKKAELFHDNEIAQQILERSSPAEAEKLGREVRGYDDKVWREHRYEIVKQGNFHKFGQNDELKEFLLTTGDRILVEASPVDGMWGIGLDADNPDAVDPEKWQGLNLLGFALMEVRDELR